MSVFVTGLKKQCVAFMVDGPKAVGVIGGKKSPSTINALNVGIGTITLLCEGVHIGAMYDVAPGGFDWTDYDGLLKLSNPSESVSGGIINSGNGPGTLIRRVKVSDPSFSTAFRK